MNTGNVNLPIQQIIVCFEFQRKAFTLEATDEIVGEIWERTGRKPLRN